MTLECLLLVSSFFDQINSIEVEMNDGSELPLETGIEHLGDGREGLSRYNPDNRCLEILLAPSTYEALEKGSPRAAYCLVHEFSHAWLHGEQLRQLAELPQPSQIAFHRGAPQPAHPMYLDTEWQANALAAALLMPARGLSDLEQRYGRLAEDLVTRPVRRQCEGGRDSNQRLYGKESNAAKELLRRLQPGPNRPSRYEHQPESLSPPKKRKPATLGRPVDPIIDRAEIFTPIS